MIVATQTGLKSDVILGYKIIEKIGSGGFGEVWKAEAPGGLMKAVKILYGYHDERRAMEELKSLNRIKELRHPFLLSLERIEVVDQQLIVITELADRSLADLFDSYVQSGQKGIPRDELLNYMRQAAEALDYLAVEHKLQHLDVKPENLLMVGKHVKLADFGLVKDLRDVSQSLMGGLTPSFSAPELFDGRPTLQSDQYALAIVYQEMLTGQRPFAGTTLAQLASQHIHGQPDLAPLPKNDRAIIARALSKRPELRFPHSRVMIESLVDQRLIMRSSKRMIVPKRSGGDTVVSEIKPKTGDTSSPTRMLKTSEMQDAKIGVSFGDAPEVDLSKSGIGPTLIVGVGSTGTEIIQRIKHQIGSRVCDSRKLPAVKLVAIDTERPPMAETGSHLDSLDGSEQIFVPLRRSEEYRTRGEIHKRWLNRRWIYNVPKSLQTEGLRPLGRLAFVDNFSAIYEGLERAIGQISERDHVAMTAEQVSLDPAPEKAKVFIVGSICGGLGSGMLLDLAYTIRLILDEHSLKSDCIHGFLLHETSNKNRDSGIAVANTFAFLTELRHLTQNGYPGEEACGIPVLDDEAPFDFPYLLHLGDNTGDLERKRILESISEYLFANVFTPASGFFEACRDLEKDIEHFALRSFGLTSIGPSRPTCQLALADYLKNRLVDKWTGGDPESENDPALKKWNDAIGKKIISDQLQSVFNRLYRPESWKPLADSMQAWVSDLSRTDDEWTELLAKADVITGEPIRDGKSLLRDIPEDLAEEIATSSRKLIAIAESIVNSAFSGSRLRFGTALGVIESLIRSVEDLRTEISHQIASDFEEYGRVTRAIKSLRYRQNGRQQKPVAELAPELIDQLFHFRIDSILNRAVCEVLLAVARRIGSLRTDVQRMKEEVSSAIGTPDRDLTEKALLKRFSGFQQWIIESTLSMNPTTLDRVEERLYLDLVQPNGDFWQVMGNSGFARRYLPDAVSSAIAIELARAGRTIDLDKILIRMHESGKHNVTDDFAEFVQRGMPLASGFGGVTRTLIAGPMDSKYPRVVEELNSAIGNRSAVIPATSGNLLMVTETEDISLATVAFRMLECRTDCMELARRLQSRTDVPWLSLEDLLS